ncbi:MAG: hypothetical protein D6690_16525 [Nitrospirae bacterium]|nr:MAG: hypothetical protein D6690_16525 [Nitrospirota bacterium]
MFPAKDARGFLALKRAPALNHKVRLSPDTASRASSIEDNKSHDNPDARKLPLSAKIWRRPTRSVAGSVVEFDPIHHRFSNPTSKNNRHDPMFGSARGTPCSAQSVRGLR